MVLLLSEIIRPLDPFEEIRREALQMDRIAEDIDFILPAAIRRRRVDEAHSPAESGFSVKVNVNGFEPEDLRVSVEDKTLVISGEHKEEDEQTSIHKTFTRKFRLPDDVDPAQLKSKLCEKDGFLSIEAPKPRKETQKRKIPIEIEFVSPKKKQMTIERSTAEKSPSPTETQEKASEKPVAAA